jgi:hypothetical protein
MIDERNTGTEDCSVRGAGTTSLERGVKWR